MGFKSFTKLIQKVTPLNQFKLMEKKNLTNMSKRNIKKSYNRILEISEDAKQITMPDSRYYRRNGEYYPSITYVLGTYPKGKFFEDWLKKVGYSAEYIVKKSRGTGY